jgi:uncharacterized protein (DUF1778 family)
MGFRCPRVFKSSFQRKPDLDRLIHQLYALNQYKPRSLTMPQNPVESNSRMSLRIPAEEKALLLRAVAIQRTSLTDFVIQTAVAQARAVIDQAERIELSQRDSLHVLDLLENPPEPNEKLMKAAHALPTSK